MQYLTGSKEVFNDYAHGNSTNFENIGWLNWIAFFLRAIFEARWLVTTSECMTADFQLSDMTDFLKRTGPLLTPLWKLLRNLAHHSWFGWPVRFHLKLWTLKGDCICSTTLDNWPTLLTVSADVWPPSFMKVALIRLELNIYLLSLMEHGREVKVGGTGVSVTAPFSLHGAPSPIRKPGERGILLLCSQRLHTWSSVGTKPW